MYLETSVISAYFNFWKSNPEQKEQTILLWRLILPKYKVYISQVNVIEIDAVKNQEWRASIEDLVENIERLPITKKVENLAKEYISNAVIPSSKINDALHLAITVSHKIDYLLTWNFKHLSRPYQKRKIFEFNQSRGLYTPIIIEPAELIKEIAI